LKLWDEGWLTFNPESTPHLDEAQEAEMRFVGSLVAGGCTPAMLSGLRKPYSLDGSRFGLRAARIPTGCLRHHAAQFVFGFVGGPKQFRALKSPKKPRF
jgi:hypothetical protein